MYPTACAPQYVLRAVYREVLETQGAPIGMTSASSATAVAAATVAAESTEGRFGHHPTMATDDPGATELRTLSTASRGLLQRTRVLSKRLNSLCALHSQLMWELEKGRRVRPGGFEPMEETLAFPDPFELGTLEVSKRFSFVISLNALHVMSCGFFVTFARRMGWVGSAVYRAIRPSSSALAIQVVTRRS